MAASLQGPLYVLHVDESCVCIYQGTLVSSISIKDRCKQSAYGSFQVRTVVDDVLVFVQK